MHRTTSLCRLEIRPFGTVAQSLCPPALFFVLCLITILVSGCSAGNSLFGGVTTTRGAFDEDNTPIIELNNAAADELGDGLDDDELPEGSPIYFDRFSNRINPALRAPLGEIIADQVAARLAENDFLVMDGKPAPAPLPVPEVTLPAENEADSDTESATNGGGFFSGTPQAKRPATLVGTYQIGRDVIWINARIRRLEDGAIVSSRSWTLPINDNTRALLPGLEKESGTEPSVNTTF